MRDKIIQVSIPLFDTHGYSETSIQDIVDAIGVTKGTFYYYYKSKQELLKDINLTYIQNLLLAQEEILNNNTQTYKEKLYNNVLLIIRNIRKQRQSARIFAREIRHLQGENLEIVRHIRNKFRNNTQSIITKGIEAGEFNKNIRPDILTLGILGITNWSYYWFNPDGEVSEKQLTNYYMELILNGINQE
ncbi:TetR family transcriptional regulator [Oceanobacillus sp. E9]|uniref:TetR/AcrR family transcriptional regulator n=1 Tax=Oceanobacillus TaxID=182709 RepID=UPI00084E93D9|nr:MULTISPECIES: TetR/AcrR family transcriptional regulator [Oceanobacillus]OEH53442.1 TetR family transcriptional regulator [Oceanobacillus sp. E9]